MSLVNPPLSLYIHFPWCIKKCPYCDFNSHTLKEKLTESSYIDALITDLDNDLAESTDLDGSGGIRERKLTSIFMGGGTPSLFSASSFSKLLEQLGQRIAFDDSIEITLEANPGSLEHDQFEAYLESGINRLSLGIQSFDDVQLAALGRIHNAETAHRAVEAAKQAGFKNFNLDMMYGLPNQTVEMAVNDCAEAMSHAPHHLSFYQLTIEPNTYFHQFPPTLPDNDQQFEIQTAIQDSLKLEDYHQYEISAYSITGHECQHNLNYWKFGDYLGVGAGAHSKMTRGDKIFRSWKQKHPETYIARIEASAGFPSNDYKKENSVNRDDLVFEFMMNGLRLKGGISLQLFKQRVQLPEEAALQALQPAIARSWVEKTGQWIRCTERGYLFIDEILQDLLPDSGS